MSDQPKRISDTKSFTPTPPIAKISDYLEEDIILIKVTRKKSQVQGAPAGVFSTYYRLDCIHATTGETLIFNSSQSLLLPRWEALDPDDLPVHITFFKLGNAYDVR